MQFQLIRIRFARKTGERADHTAWEHAVIAYAYANLSPSVYHSALVFSVLLSNK